MIMKLLSLLGSALVGLVLFATVGTMTGSMQLGVIVTAVCAFTLGIAAGRDGIWTR